MTTQEIKKNLAAYVEHMTPKIHELLAEMDENTSVRSILADIYCSKLEGKSRETAYLMADQIIQSVKTYHKELKKAMDNPEQYIDSFMKQLSEGLSVSERYLLWQKLEAAVAAMANADEEPIDSEALLRQLNAIHPQDIEIPEAEEAEKRQQVKELFLKNEIAAVNAIELTLNYDKPTTLDNFIDTLKEEEKDAVRAIAAMIFYTAVISGDVEYDADITPDIAACMVCTAFEIQRVQHAVQAGVKLVAIPAFCAIGLVLTFQLVVPFVVGAFIVGAGMIVSNIFLLPVALLICSSAMAVASFFVDVVTDVGVFLGQLVGTGAGNLVASVMRAGIAEKAAGFAKHVAESVRSGIGRLFARFPQMQAESSVKKTTAVTV